MASINRDFRPGDSSGSTSNAFVFEVEPDNPSPPSYSSGDVLRYQYQVSGDATWYYLRDLGGSTHELTLPASPSSGSWFPCGSPCEYPYYNDILDDLSNRTFRRQTTEAIYCSEYISILNNGNDSVSILRGSYGCPVIGELTEPCTFELAGLRIENTTTSSYHEAAVLSVKNSACCFHKPMFVDVIVDTELSGSLAGFPAQLTVSSTSFDGVSNSSLVNRPVLIVGQANAQHNGIWTVVTAGGSSTVFETVNGGTARPTLSYPMYEARYGTLNQGNVYTLTNAIGSPPEADAGYNEQTWTAGTTCDTVGSSWSDTGDTVMACIGGMEWRSAWLSGQGYTVGTSTSACFDSVVTHNDETFVCIQNHTSGGSPDITEPGVGSSWESYWERLAVWLPSGGTAGDSLVRASGSPSPDYSVDWLPVGIPPGGNPGQVLSKSAGSPSVDYNVEWTDLGSLTGNVIWRGYWEAGASYVENDFVTHNGNSFMCLVDHTSSTDNEPDPVFDYEGGFEWILVSQGLEQEEKSLFDNLFGGVFDWIGDIGNWGLGDWVKLLAVGGGLVWVGSKLTDMFSGDGVGDGQAQSQYTGDTCYSGAFTAPQLSEVVSDICDWAGITSYDVSDLPSVTVDFTIGSLTSARSILEMLSQVYFFDIVDSGGTLKFIDRTNTTAVKTLTEVEDLGWTRDGDSIPAPYTVKRYQSVDLPRSVSLTYSSQAMAHGKMTQTATLQTFISGQDVHIEVPITLTEAKAYSVAEKTMVAAHVERMVYSFTTNWKHLDLEPGDVVEVDTIGTLRILRVDEEQEFGLLTIQATDATYNGAYTYADSGINAQDPEPYTDTPKVIGYSAGLIVEMPPMDGSDKDSPRLMLAPHGYGLSDWPGCVIYVSTDGVNYSQFGSASQEATWGKVATATAAPPSTSPYLWDNTTTIQVELKTGTLSSASELEVYNGSNWALVGDELIGFKTATLVSGTTYNLTGLLRGRRGTNVYMDQHDNDEAFILLDDALIEFPYDINTKETTRYFKFVTIGSDISKATAYDAQPSTVSIRPWKVADLTAVQSGTDWNISWIGTNQFDGEMVDSGPVPNPHKFGGFVIQILDQLGSPQTVKRTITQQTTSYTYTEAQQIADFGSAQSSVVVRVAQIDQRVGPGYDNTQEY